MNGCSVLPHNFSLLSFRPSESEITVELPISKSRMRCGGEGRVEVREWVEVEVMEGKEFMEKGRLERVKGDDEEEKGKKERKKKDIERWSLRKGRRLKRREDWRR